MQAQALLFLLVTGGTLLTSLTGLGGGTLVLAGLMLVYPPELAIPLHSFTQLSANGLRSLLFYRAVKWRVVWAYASLILPFAWIGAWLFDYVNPSWLKLIVGSFILFSLIPLKWHRGQEPSLWTFASAGAASGFLGVFVGAVGPMVTPLFNRIKTDRQGNISTKSAGQMLLQLFKVIAFSGAANVDFLQLKESVAVLVAGTLIGVSLSIPIGKKLSDRKFEFLVNALLALIALKVIYEGAVELIGN
jgi:uncharacterized membrane protein YfcA